MNKQEILLLLRNLVERCTKDNWDNDGRRTVWFDPELLVEIIEKELAELSK